jgi:competence protein ComEC
MNPVRRFITAWYALIGVTCAVIVYLSIPLAFDRGLRVYFFDIGQGDATYIRTADHRNILIDGGPDNTVLYRLGAKLPWYDRTIDAVILTHHDADHLIGLIEVLRRHRVKTIIITPTVKDTHYVTIWNEAVAREGATIITITDPQVIQFGVQTYFYILHPQSMQAIAQERDINNNSIVGNLVFGETSVLLMGDYEDEERFTAATKLSADVIKVGHHGARNGTSEQFAQLVAPQYAIASAGKNNRYGHPHPETKAIWEKVGAIFLRTNCNGTITLYSDGKTFTVTPDQACD